MASRRIVLALVAAVCLGACDRGPSPAEAAAEEACHHFRDFLSALRAQDEDGGLPHVRELTEAANRSDRPELRRHADELRAEWTRVRREADAGSAGPNTKKAVAAAEGVAAECEAIGVEAED